MNVVKFWGKALRRHGGASGVVFWALVLSLKNANPGKKKVATLSPVQLYSSAALLSCRALFMIICV
jgi:hypothetical protein